MKQEGDSSTLLFNFGFEYAIKNLQGNKGGLELNATLKFLI
jgi:hypothetical protein